MLWKLKSRKKTDKLNLLIGLNKGVASVQSLELAMLFCHGGFNVKTIFLGNERTYIASEAIKEITGHMPWSKEHKPGWIKAEINYTGTIIIEPDKEIQNLVLSENHALKEAPPYVSYIKSKSQKIIILQKEEFLELIPINIPNKEIIPLPSNPLKLRILFQEILSKVVKLAASEALEKKMLYYFLGNAPDIAYTHKLKLALESDGIKEGEPSELDNREEMASYTKLIISDGEKSIEAALESQPEENSPNQHKIYLNKHKNGLMLQDSNGTRLLPEFSCQSCYARLISYLKTELSRKNIL